MQYINVVGNSAMGKSTFSKALARKLSLGYIELDNLFWKDNWEETPTVEFFAKIEAQLERYSDGWVVDGNYTRTIPIKWQKVDTVIWLDYPFALNLYRAVKRAIHRGLTQQTLWQHSNNHETLAKLFSKDSIVLWMIQNHKVNQEKYAALMNDPQYAQIRFVHLKSPKQAALFLKNCINSV